MNQDQKIQAMLSKMKELFPEETANMQLQTPDEVKEMLIEAQSVIWWFETEGKQFKDKHCKWCGCLFMYSWNVSSIAFCSIECIKSSLRNIGIEWNPNKSDSERWGKTRPAVIGKHATKLIKEIENGREQRDESSNNEHTDSIWD